MHGICSTYLSGNVGKVEIDVRHVGQENCVLVKFSPDDESSKYMLVDIGRATYKTGMFFANLKMDAKSKEENKNVLVEEVRES